MPDRPYQTRTFERMRKAIAEGNKRICTVMPTGCHAAGQKLLTDDLRVVSVEDVRVGDTLMGPDGKARRVLGLCGGFGRMYRIAPVKGESFVVNEDHVLSLVNNDTKSAAKGSIVDVSVKDYLGWAKYRKHTHKLFRVGVDCGSDLPGAMIDPYLLGCLLGDGGLTKGVTLTTPDPEMHEALALSAKSFGLGIVESLSGGGTRTTKAVTNRRGGINPLIDELRRLGLYGFKSDFKFIPIEYKTAGRSIRLRLFAGLMDSDGCRSKGGFDFISKSKRLSEDVVFVARSLGLAAYLSAKECTGFGVTGIYWRVSVSGDCSVVPCRVRRKQPPVRQQIKNVLRTGFAVTEEPPSRYYGFTLDGDHRYLLDDFTVTHNSGKGYLAGRLSEMSIEKGNSAAFLAARRELIFQVQRQLDTLGVPSTAVMSGVTNEFVSASEHDAAKMCHVMAKDTLFSRAFRNAKMKLPEAKLLQIDECHESISKTYMSVLSAYDNAHQVGWTATPCRLDGRSLRARYDCLVLGATYKELQNDGYLTPVKVIVPKLRPDLSDIGGKLDYNEKELERRLNKDEMVGDIVAEWRRNNPDQLSTIGFFCSVQHSIHARDEFRKLLGKDRVEHIDGKLGQSERDDIMGRIRDGRVLVTCNYGIAHTGVDVPRWKYLINARPTKSFMLHRQMGGRIQRPWDSVPFGIIQDHTDNTINFGYPDEDVAWCLDTDVRAQDLPRTKRNQVPGDKPSRTCTKCGCSYTGALCANCGHQEQTEQKGKAVTMQDGVLYELKRNKPKKKATMADKQTAWQKHVGIAIRNDMKIGAAAHMYKKEFGVWPAKLQGLPSGPEWQMTAKNFYHEVAKPRAEAAKIEAKRQADEFAANQDLQTGLFPVEAG